MKKNVLIIIGCLFFSNFHVSAQGNTNIVEVGNTKIIIPLPANYFNEVGIEIRESLKTFVKDDDKLLCFYFDSSDYRKLIYKAQDTIKMEQYILIKSPLQSIKNDLYQYQIAFFNKNTMETNTAIIKHGIDSLNKILEDTKLIVASDNHNKLHTEGRFYQTKDVGGVFVYEIQNRFNRNYLSLGTFSTIIVKKKALSFEIYCAYKNEESIKWIVELTQSWAKAIIEANK